MRDIVHLEPLLLLQMRLWVLSRRAWRCRQDGMLRRPHQRRTPGRRQRDGLIVDTVRQGRIGSGRLVRIELIDDRLLKDLRALTWPVLDDRKLSHGNIGRLPGCSSRSSATGKIDEEA